VTPDAIVMAAGQGRRLRPLTERWPKAILPIDGRPVIATLLRELAAAGVARVWLVTGHLRESIQAFVGDGAAFGLDVRDVHQPAVLGSADAVARAVDAGASAPLVVSAADTVFEQGDILSFVDEFGRREVAGAIAVRSEPPPGPGRPGIEVGGGLVREIGIGDTGERLSGAPLWGLGSSVLEFLRSDSAPYELENSFRAAIEAGARIAAIEIGKTRDLTHPLDLVQENFPYLAQ
jgi:NDP-sugar pyrophosphorylase family protein